MWIRPLLLIKLGLMAFINLRLDLFWHKKEAAASTVCLTGIPCRLFFVVVVAYKAWLYGFYQFTFRFILA